MLKVGESSDSRIKKFRSIDISWRLKGKPLKQFINYSLFDGTVVLYNKNKNADFIQIFFAKTREIIKMSIERLNVFFFCFTKKFAVENFWNSFKQICLFFFLFCKFSPYDIFCSCKQDAIVIQWSKGISFSFQQGNRQKCIKKETKTNKRRNNKIMQSQKYH